MTLPIFDSGNQSISGWALETTPGTPVTVATYLPSTPGAVTPVFDPGMTAIDIAAGSINSCIAVVPKRGRGQWAITYEFYPTLGTTFITNNGFTTTIVRPASFTLTMSGAMKAYQYPGCRCNRMSFRMNNSGGITVAQSGFFTAKPVPIAALSAPSISGQDPYVYDDAGQCTLITGAVTANDMESFMLTLDMPHAMGYGNSGTTLANISVLQRVRVGGTISAYMNDTNIAEIVAANALDGTTGSLALTLTKASKSAAFAIGNAKYGSGNPSWPSNGLDLITLPWIGFSPTLGNQASLTLV